MGMQNFVNQLPNLSGVFSTTTPSSTATTTPAPVVQSPSNIPGSGALPALRTASATSNSRIDPALQPYLNLGLQKAEQLFMGQPQPTLYPGQMYVSPSQQTQQALAMQEALASQAAPILSAGQASYLQSLGQIGQTAGGSFLQGNPYQQQMVEAATRPLTQQYAEQVVPGIASLYSKAGRYGSGAMESALGRASEQYGRALGDVTSNIVGQDYARERALQQQAQMGQAALAQAAPSFFQSSFLPAQALAQVGAAQESIAQKPLSEAIQRYQYSQQLPYQQLQGYLSSVYGTPMGSSQYQPIPQAQTNVLGQALGGAGLGYLGGSLLTNQFGANAPLYGAGLGAILGGLL